MAFSVNKVTLVGNVSQDPELTYTPKGNALLKFNMATNHSVRNEAGEWSDIPSFHRIVVWAKQAEYFGGTLKKGDKVYIEGRIEYGSYEKDGIKRYTIDIVAKDVITMANKGQMADSGGNSGSSAPVPKKKAAVKKNDAKKSSAKQEEVNVDDIPF